MRQEGDDRKRGPGAEVRPPTLINSGGRGQQPISNERNCSFQTEDPWQIQLISWEWSGSLPRCRAQGDKAVQQTKAGLWWQAACVNLPLSRQGVGGRCRWTSRAQGDAGRQESALRGGWQVWSGHLPPSRAQGDPGSQETEARGVQHVRLGDLPPGRAQEYTEQTAQVRQSALAHSNLPPCWAHGEREPLETAAQVQREQRNLLQGVVNGRLEGT